MKKLILLLICSISSVLFAQGFESVVVNKTLATGYIRQLSFLDDTTLVFCRNGGKGFSFISLRTLECKKELSGLQGKPQGFSISHNRKYLIGHSIENEVGVWEISSGSLLYSLGEYDKMNSQPRSIEFASNDLQFIINDGCDLKVYETKTGSLIRTIISDEMDCIYSGLLTKNIKSLYGNGNNGVWSSEFLSDSQSDRKIMDLPQLGVTNTMKLSPNEKMLAVGGREGLVLLNSDLSTKNELVGHSEWISDLAFSANSKVLYSCSGSFQNVDYSVRAWDTETGECMSILGTHRGSVMAINLSQNQHLLASGGADQSIKIWNARTNSLLCTIVPMRIDKEEKLFFYTESGTYFGPNEFFKLVLFDGKQLNPQIMPGVKRSQSEFQKMLR